jgi:hypothetical protein
MCKVIHVCTVQEVYIRYILYTSWHIQVYACLYWYMPCTDLGIYKYIFVHACSFMYTQHQNNCMHPGTELMILCILNSCIDSCATSVLALSATFPVYVHFMICRLVLHDNNGVAQQHTWTVSLCQAVPAWLKRQLQVLLLLGRMVQQLLQILP